MCLGYRTLSACMCLVPLPTMGTKHRQRPEYSTTEILIGVLIKKNNNNKTG
uniref:Uncharacterized protein n=1 Tax=Rhizophora mucronata TaxID=61149 RepID=A0A2P2Q8M0_RHIMU